MTRRSGRPRVEREHGRSSTNPCAGCQRLQAQLEQLQAAVARLQEQLAAARKDSSTSSKPPSSDIVKPPKPPPPPGQDKRKPRRPARPPQARTRPVPPRANRPLLRSPLDACPCCAANCVPTARTGPGRPAGRSRAAAVDRRAAPQSRILVRPLRRSYEAPLPDHIATGGLVGPRLTTLIAYLKGACHASFSTVRKFLRDVVAGDDLARPTGQDHRQGQPGAGATLSGVARDLPGEARLNVDETGHKQNGQRQWTWCFRASLYTLFKIDPHRSGRRADRGAGHGVRRGAGLRLLLRLPPLHARVRRAAPVLPGPPDPRREVPDDAARHAGPGLWERLREALRTLFGVIHRREQMPKREFQKRLEAARDEVLQAGTQDVPENSFTVSV